MKIYFNGALIALMSVILSACGQTFQSEDHASTLGAGEFILDDMIIDESEIEAPPTTNSGGFQTQAADGFYVYNSRKWSNGIIPIEFDSSISTTNRDNFNKACAMWSAAANIKCVPRSGQSGYVYVTDNSSGCFSYVGAGSGGKRDLNLASNCWGQGTILHELGHAMGLMHEHQRPDRDSYVAVQLQNVQSGYAYAFDKFGTAGVKSAYDFMSIMHYWYKAFSANGNPTLVPRAGYESYATSMGGSSVLSAGDKSVMASIYGSTTTTQTTNPDPVVTSGDTVAPSVSLTSPLNGARLPRYTTVTLSANASDNVGVASVTFYVNGSAVCTDTTAPYSCSWRTPWFSGSRTIQAKARDAKGNVGSSSLNTVTIY
jgi:hypothetical protein